MLLTPKGRIKYSKISIIISGIVLMMILLKNLLKMKLFPKNRHMFYFMKNNKNENLYKIGSYLLTHLILFKLE